MKRKKLLQHLTNSGCEIVGEGKKHTKVQNLDTGRKSFVPRHSEIGPNLIREICKQLDIPAPSEK